MASQPTTGSATWSGAAVRVKGDVDLSTAPAMRAALDQAWRDGKDDLLVDLSDATFMDCAGLTVLLQARRAWGGRLSVHRPPASLRRILQALDMEGAFAIVDVVGPDPR